MPTVGTLGAAEKTTFTWAASAVLQVLSIEPPELDRAMIDKTALGDTNKSARPSTITEVKECTLKVNYSNTNHATLVTALTSQTGAAAIIEFFDASGNVVEKWSWAQAFIKSVKVDSVSIDKNVEASIVVHFNDYPTLATA